MRVNLFALLLLAGSAAAQTSVDLPPADARGELLIRGATVLTVTNGTHENTDILVRDGRIEEIGQGLNAPNGVQIVDGTGLHVMPGIVDAHAHIALSNVNESRNTITAEVQMGDVTDPTQVNIYRALAGGVTTIHTLHGSANAIGGESETLKLRYGTFDPNDLHFEGAPRTIKFALGENPTRVHGRGRDIRPRSRMGVEQLYREAFSEARRYRDAQSAAEANDSTPPPYSRRMETLADILDGEILIHCHSYRADEIVMLMNVLNDFGVERITFQHVNEGFKVAPELAAFGAGASVFSDWWAYKFEVYYSTAYNVAILLRNGVRASINSDSSELIRHLFHEAAKSQRYGGLTDDEALSLITINPAWQLGIDDWVGSIEEGKDADFAIFDGHPLSIYARPVITIVDGIVRFDEARDGDDMRLDIDPEAEIEDVRLYDHNEKSCLVDAFVL